MMEIFLNRWRGTGGIFSIFSITVTGNMIYALYIGLLFGFITTWYIGFMSILLFIFGESFGWGKWIGALISPNEINKEMAYKDDEGKRFPYIHYVVEIFVKERDNFLLYCNLALFLRGMIWALFLYLALAVFEYISIVEYIIISIVWGFGFPFGCWLSTKRELNYRNRFISIFGKWETQEIYFGFIHFICNMYVVWGI